MQEALASIDWGALPPAGSSSAPSSAKVDIGATAAQKYSTERPEFAERDAFCASAALGK